MNNRIVGIVTLKMSPIIKNNLKIFRLRIFSSSRFVGFLYIFILNQKK